MSRIEVQSPQGEVQEGQRLMIIELGKCNETDALLIETDSTGVMGTHMLSGQGPECICNYGSCPHREGRDRGMNKK